MLEGVEVAVSEPVDEGLEGMEIDVEEKFFGEQEGVLFVCIGDGLCELDQCRY